MKRLPTLLLVLAVLFGFRLAEAVAGESFAELMDQGNWPDALAAGRAELAASLESVSADSFVNLAQSYAEMFLARDQVDPAREIYAVVTQAWAAGDVAPSVPLAHAVTYAAYVSLLADDEDDARTKVEQARALLAETHSADPGLAFETADLLFTIVRQILADHDLSVRLGEEALLRAAEVPDLAPFTRASVCNILAEEYRAWHGDYQRAEELLIEAIRIVEPFHLDQEGFPRIHAGYSGFINDLASLYEVQGNLVQAERLYRQALTLVEGNPAVAPSRRIVANLNLGVVYLDQMRLSEAEPLLATALTLARPGFATDTRLIYCLTEMARLHREQEKYTRSIAEFEEAISLLNADADSDPFFLSQANYDLGNLYLKTGDTRTASARFEQALTLRREMLGAENPATAVALVAWVSTDPVGLTSVMKTRLLSEAIAVLSSDVANEPVRVEALGLRGRAYQESAEAELARLDFEQALKLAESVRGRRGGNDESRARYLASIRSIHEDLLALNLRTGHRLEALRVAESAKARSLADRLAGIDLRTSGTVERVLPARQRALQSRIASLQRAKNSALRAANSRQVQRLNGEIRQTFQELNRVSDELDLNDDTWQNHLAGAAPDSFVLDDLREVLGPDEAALVYFVGQARSYAFLLTDEAEIRVFELGGEAALFGQSGSPSLAMHAQTLSRAREGALRSVGGIAYADAEPTPDALGWRLRSADLKRLFKSLVPAELWQSISEYEELVILPDGLLHAIPFAALVVEAGATASTTRFWLDEGPALRYAPSLASLISLARRPAPGGARYDLLSIVNPAYAGNGPWAQLPGTLAEGELVRKPFPVARRKIFTGAEATEAHLKEFVGQARYIHLATHGMVRDDSVGLMAALILTPELASDATPEDGYFHLYEIRQTPLNAQLAVLSACETNWGRSVPSEGVLTISRAFLEAGARRTLASLWPVSDASTAELVGDFFQGVARCDSLGVAPPYSLLLRDAKRKVRNSAAFSDPHHWAPFVLSGLN